MGTGGKAATQVGSARPRNNSIGGHRAPVKYGGQRLGLMRQRRGVWGGGNRALGLYGKHDRVRSPLSSLMPWEADKTKVAEMIALDKTRVFTNPLVASIGEGEAQLLFA